MNSPVCISIVIPVFNAEPFLAACLDSVFSNTGSFEVIAINDASSDRSLSILDDYAKRHSNLTVVRFSQNKGVSAARNAGIAHSRGQYIMFCDPDDSFVPGAIQYIISLLAKASVLPDVVFFKHQSVNNQTQPINPRFDAALHRFDMENEQEAIACFSRLFTLLWAWNGAFKQSVFGSLRFDESLWPFEDILWGVQCTCRCRTVLETDAVLYRYHQHPASCLHRIFFSRVRSEIQGTFEFYREARNWRFFNKVKKIAFLHLNFRAFARPIDLAEALPKQDRDQAWDLVFKCYTPMFKDVVPVLLRPLYMFALKSKSRLLVKYAIAYPIKTKDRLLNIGIRRLVFNLFSRGKPEECKEAEPPRGD